MGAITTEASGKIAGYIFQFQRALFRLLSSDASNLIVGIETEDDVVEIIFDDQLNPKIILEQDKHTVNLDKNTYQDSSKNLWHSLHIWLDSMDECQNKFSIINYILVTNTVVNADSFVHQLAAAKTESEVQECIYLIKEIASKCIDGKGNAEKIKTVAAYPEEKLNFLIKNLELGDINATKDESNLRLATQNLFHLPDDYKKYAEEIYQSLIGFIILFCQEKWKNKDSAWLDQSKINKRLFQEISIRRIRKFIEKPLMSTRYKEYLQSDNSEHLFLKQLITMGIKDIFCDQALEHYWGFYSEKVRLEDEGEALPSEWEERNSGLYDRWKSIFVDEQTFNLDIDEIEIAKKIILKTLDPNYLAPLGQNPTVHNYFTRGNYHYLANTDNASYFVYWHSLYLK
jgi:hypothetical protein